MAAGVQRSGGAGYLGSALIFAAITALWAYIVREDAFYRFVEIAGVRLPATTIIYLTMMPLVGFLVGRWRYHGLHVGGATSYGAKLVARTVHFIYAHSLLVLFTFAMATNYFLGLNIDEQVKSLDNQMFDLAARFAPWLSAYLAGYNLGRAVVRDAPVTSGVDIPFEGVERIEATTEPPREKKAAAKPAKKQRGRKSKNEPVFIESAFVPSDSAEIGDLAATPHEPRHDAAQSGGAPLRPAAAPPQAATAEPGFLAPQDLEKLRPTFHQLR